MNRKKYIAKPMYLTEGGEVVDELEQANANEASAKEESKSDVIEEPEDEIAHDLPAAVANYLSKHGNKKITDLEVSRAPIQKTLDFLLDIISAGKYNQVKKKLGYDSFNHLALRFELEDGEIGTLEKNQTIKIKPYTTRNNEELMSVKIRGSPTLNSLINKAISKYGNSRIQQYSPFKYNCQMFLLDLLSASGLLTNSVRSFIKQDVKELAEEFGHEKEDIINKITQSAGYLDKILQRISGGAIVLKDGGVVP